MAKREVLARVRADLAAGHTHVAIQRLRTLLAAIPADLEVRLLLCSVYRQTGNLAEAGRWGFLTDDVRDAELAAYARANPDPWRRLRLLSFDGDASMLSEPAAQRLVALAEEAERSGPPQQWIGSYRAPSRNPGTVLPCLFTAIVLGTTAVLVIIGMVRVIVWVVD